MADKELDFVVFGATSFVGQILCRYLVDRHGVDGDVGWAMAGRSESKLKEVRGALGGDAGSLPLIVADADDESALTAMCERARVVISTVGPYALYGSTLVGVCAKTGTDYCDLTGEVQWIRRMIDQHEAAARKSGARIIHCCGFDSIPSDLGVLFHQQVARERFGQPSEHVRMRVKRILGGASGGTVASMMNISREAAKDPALRKALADPYLLCPKNGAARVRQASLGKVTYDRDNQSWVAPFVMGAINSRVVLRSNALQGHAYGPEFRYDEAMFMGRGVAGGVRAGGMTAGLGAFFAGAAFPPSAWLLGKVVPKPGEGPSPEEQENGMFDLRFYSNAATGEKLETRVTGDRDPGYGSTAKMLGEAGLCLSRLGPDRKGGFWTPASGLGTGLIDQLQKHAGLTFEVMD